MKEAMNNLNDIFEAEIKNLYALEKQIIAVVPTLEDHAENKKLQKRIAKIKKQSTKQFHLINEQLKSMEVNPGNTYDHVANEMIINLEKTAKQDLSTAVKDTGILTSLIRLLHYKKACYQITRQTAGHLSMNNLKDDLKPVIKKTRKHLKKLKKAGKKAIYYNAAE